jgi:RNA polymerase sigma-B factor
MSELATTTDEDALFARYRRSGRSADLEALVVRYMPLARSLAGRYRSGNEREDVLQVAYLGLLKAIERFEPERASGFPAFAVPTILGEVKRHFRDRGWSVRVPRDVQELARRADQATDALTAELGRTPTVAEVAQRCGAGDEQVLEARATITAHYAVSLDTPVREEEADETLGARLATSEDGYARVEDGLDFDHLVATLPPRERAILRLRFGQGLRQREIAEQLGISQMHVSRLIAKSLTALEPVAHGSTFRTGHA